MRQRLEAEAGKDEGGAAPVWRWRGVLKPPGSHLTQRGVWEEGFLNIRVRFAMGGIAGGAGRAPCRHFDVMPSSVSGYCK